MTKDEYSQNPKRCLQCKETIPFEKKVNKFCCHPCSAYFRRTDSPKKETSHGLVHNGASVEKTKKQKVAKPKATTAKPSSLKNQKSQSNVMIKIHQIFDVASYKILYENVDSLVGVYAQTKKAITRIIVILKLNNGKNTIRSYPRAIYEIHLGRVLDFPNETVHHIDNNPANNELSNLQILSLDDNIKKAHADGIAYKTPKGTKVNFDTSGGNNGMAKLSNDDVLKYRILYTSGTSKNEIIRLSGVTRRSVSNFLFGITYSSVGEICVSRPYER